MGIKIEFSTFEFSSEHGEKPRGRGGWGFFLRLFSGVTESGARPVIISNSCDVERVIWAVDPARGSMTYGEAKDWMKDAVRAFGEISGVREGRVVVEVAP